MTIKTRFAPSPTGVLHLGSVRTAVFAWLYAKKHAGEFILRIEDTDRARSESKYVDAILEGMKWLNLNHSGDVVYQSQRFERYEELANKLLASGDAYYCQCSKERLEKVREEQLAAKQKPKYDGKCRELALEKTADAVIRFKTPTLGSTAFHDHVYGDVEIANQELDDVILVRSDGVPTYNFTVVVDDMDMNISHVIRGDDHLNNTPRQINILKALGGELPSYVHLPMILGSDGSKLSKRHGALSILAYRDEGYLPETLLNYLVKLGWSHGDQEIFTLDEMISLFDIAHIQKSAARFDETKLEWMNQQYIKQKPADALVQCTREYLSTTNQEIYEQAGPSLEQLTGLVQSRVKTLKEMATDFRYFYQDEVQVDMNTLKENSPENRTAIIDSLITELSSITEWSVDQIGAMVKGIAKEHELKFPVLAKMIRLIITGQMNTPNLSDTMYLISKQTILTRLVKAKKALSA